MERCIKEVWINFNLKNCFVRYSYRTILFLFSDVDNFPQGIYDILTQFEKVLAGNNINSSECLQKAICSYVQSSTLKSEEARSAKNIDDYEINNSIRYVIYAG